MELIVVDTRLPSMTSYLETIVSFMLGLPREGPGDDRYTEHLYALLALPPSPRVADMGSGSGAATLVLARLGADVTAVDLVPEFLQRLARRAEREGLSDRVRTMAVSMDAVPADVGPFDLIWSEGALYTIGFDRGLTVWRDLLVPEGYVVVSEMSWLVDDPPAEAWEYWRTAYPGMRSVAENEAAIRAAGYRWLGSVLLPDEAWEAFYVPQRERLAEWKNRALSAREEDLVREVEEEMRLSAAHRTAYGYVFYLMRRED
ncbi:Methyltransferase domain protein [anaerobic digester metagenome]